MNESPKPSEIIIMAAGAVLFISSFLEWFGSDFGDGANGWDDGLFPIVPIIALFGLAMAVLIALDRFGNANLPGEVAGFTWPQIHLVLAVFTALVSISFLLLDKGEADIGIGLILGVLSSIGLVVGAVMLQREPAAGASPAGPSQSF